MKKKMMINGIHRSAKNDIKLLTNEKENLTSYLPAGQILVDSDECSFIYLIEKDNEYTYVVIKEEYWSELKHALETNGKLYLANEGSELELIDFMEELTFLIENIRGNSNYGEAMVKKVEEIF